MGTPQPFAPLTWPEFESLCEVGKGPAGRAIPAEHKESLLQLGYLKETLDGVIVTRTGHMRIAEGH